MEQRNRGPGTGLRKDMEELGLSYSCNRGIAGVLKDHGYKLHGDPILYTSCGGRSKSLGHVTNKAAILNATIMDSTSFFFFFKWEVGV